MLFSKNGKNDLDPDGNAIRYLEDNWWGVKGIFTDNDYKIYDLEYDNKQIITSLKGTEGYQQKWSLNYYNHIKECIVLFLQQDIKK